MNHLKKDMGKMNQLKKDRAKTELKIKVIKVLYNFTSKEEPGVKLNKIDIINILSSIISRRTENS